MKNDIHDDQAFPTTRDNTSASFGGKGMSLRDYFAAKAMCGLLAAGAPKAGSKEQKYLALDAYDIAEAMLEARAGELDP